MGKRKRLQDLSKAISGLRQVNQSLLQAAEEAEFDAFGRYLALGLKNLPLHLTIQCQNDLQATLSGYRSRAICESSLSPASTCDSEATETSVHCWLLGEEEEEEEEEKKNRLLLTFQPKGRMLEEIVLLV